MFLKIFFTLLVVTIHARKDPFINLKASSIKLTGGKNFTYGNVTTLHNYGAVKETQYAGYMPIDKDSNMWFWFFEAQNKSMTTPPALILWLQGGPGASGLTGLFQEFGPYKISENLTLTDHPYSWNKNCHLLFVDSPVGTGYSDTNRYRTNLDDVAKDLVTFMRQFYRTYPQYKESEFYVFGESYAGKYIPKFANWVRLMATDIPLKGIAIGDGWTDPWINTQSYMDVAYIRGMISEQQKPPIEALLQECELYMVMNEWLVAADVCDSVEDTILEYAGNPNRYDIRLFEDYNFSAPGAYLSGPEINQQLFTAKTWGANNEDVYQALREDEMQSVSDILPPVVETFPTMIYNGEYDLDCNLVGVQRTWENIAWSGKNDYLNAERKVWMQGNTTRGYVRTGGGLTQVIALGGGHLYPMDQPEAALELLENFVYGDWK